MISEDGYIGARFEQLSADIADAITAHDIITTNKRVTVNRVLRKAFTDPRLLEVLAEVGVLTEEWEQEWRVEDHPGTATTLTHQQTRFVSSWSVPQETQ